MSSRHFPLPKLTISSEWMKLNQFESERVAWLRRPNASSIIDQRSRQVTKLMWLFNLICSSCFLSHYVGDLIRNAAREQESEFKKLELDMCMRDLASSLSTKNNETNFVCVKHSNDWLMKLTNTRNVEAFKSLISRPSMGLFDSCLESTKEFQYLLPLYTKHFIF